MGADDPTWLGENLLIFWQACWISVVRRSPDCGARRRANGGWQSAPIQQKPRAKRDGFCWTTDIGTSI